MNGSDFFNAQNGCVIGRTRTLLSSIGSTNSFLKENAHLFSNGHVVISREQLSGRGRQGKSFYSPDGEGLYMSVLFKDTALCEDSLFTAKMCLAVCRAIDTLTNTSNANGVGIKWVNDIYFGKSKLCGILCERFVSCNGKMCVIAGIGVNMHLDKASLPKDIRNIATSLYDITKNEYEKSTLCNLICEKTEEVFKISNADAIDEYKKRSVVIGKEINILGENSSVRAAVLDICEDGSLLVRTEHGYTQRLCAGEISIRLK